MHSFNFVKILYNRDMREIIFILIILSLQGCLYFNDRGVSANLYDNCRSYYDKDGNYIETCDENIIDYSEAKEGIKEIGKEIGSYLEYPNECEKGQIESNRCSKK